MNLTVSYYTYYCELHNIKSGEGRQLFSTYATMLLTNEQTDDIRTYRSTSIGQIFRDDKLRCKTWSLLQKSGRLSAKIFIVGWFC